MDTMGERLGWARVKAGFRSARAAALANGWNEVTYRSHENAGLNDETGRAFDFATAQRYARVFKVDPVWLLHGVGQAKANGIVPIVGLAGANPDGSVLYADSQGELGEAPIPPGGDERTVAVEVRGDSMRGVAEDGWLVFYNDRRDPPTEDLLGELCVIGLHDGRVLIKKLLRGRKKNHFDLESMAAPVLQDARVDWAAPIIAIVPRRQAQRMVVR